LRKKSKYFHNLRLTGDRGEKKERKSVSSLPRLKKEEYAAHHEEGKGRGEEKVSFLVDMRRATGEKGALYNHP